MADRVEAGDTVYVSTGGLPPRERIQALLDGALARFAGAGEGEVASYIPALAEADPKGFGIALATTDGTVATAGQCDRAFSLQSLSKPFAFALLAEEIGLERARDELGVNATGMGFDSVIAVELGERQLTNPMVNAGAIATASLIPGAGADARLAFLLDGMSAFAGRTLSVDEAVYRSEAATNRRNRGIAMLLDSYGRLGCPPEEALDRYTRQCAISVTVADVAVMAGTLANGGVHPVTGVAVVSPTVVKRVLAILCIAGQYQRSGDWLFDIGLPGKSGVSGGVMTVAPGKGGLAVWSPPLDAAGTSVRGKAVTRDLSDALGLNLFASAPRGGG